MIEDDPTAHWETTNIRRAVRDVYEARARAARALKRALCSMAIMFIAAGVYLGLLADRVHDGHPWIFAAFMAAILTASGAIGVAIVLRAVDQLQ